MAKPSDLIDKLDDAQEIVLDLIHDLSGNPISTQEAVCLRVAGDTYSLIFSAGDKARRIKEEWPE